MKFRILILRTVRVFVSNNWIADVASYRTNRKKKNIIIIIKYTKCTWFIDDNGRNSVNILTGDHVSLPGGKVDLGGRRKR